MRRAKGGSKGQQEMRIRDVWASNLKEEMDLLEQLVDKHPYISMVGPPSSFRLNRQDQLCITPCTDLLISRG